MLDDKIIRDLSGNEYTFKEVMQAAKEYSSSGHNLYIGSDSQVIKNKISIVTSICFHKQDLDKASSKIFYIKERVPKREYPTLRRRMLFEAWRSIEVAMELEPIIDDVLTVHLDVGSTIKSKTAEFHKELQSLVTGQGYDCEIKPDSWASSAVADRMSKT